MPNAPWAQAPSAPPTQNVFGVGPANQQLPAGTTPTYEMNGANGMSHGDGSNANDPSLIYAGGTVVVDTAMLDQLRNIVLGDPNEAQRVLHEMGWQGTVDDFKALTPAQQNVWATQNAASTKTAIAGGRTYEQNQQSQYLHKMLSDYEVFYKDPVTGVYDFTKWYDGSTSGYDANMVAAPGVRIQKEEKLKQRVYDQYLTPQTDKMAQQIAQQYGASMPKPVPTTPRIVQPRAPEATIQGGMALAGPQVAPPPQALGSQPPSIGTGMPNMIKPLAPPRQPGAGTMPPEMRIR